MNFNRIPLVFLDRDANSICRHQRIQFCRLAVKSVELDLSMSWITAYDRTFFEVGLQRDRHWFEKVYSLFTFKSTILENESGLILGYRMYG